MAITAVKWMDTAKPFHSVGQVAGRHVTNSPGTTDTVDLPSDLFVRPASTVDTVPAADPSLPPVTWMPSPNYHDRPPGAVVDTVVIHHTDHFPSVWSVGHFFQRSDARASSHFIVGKDGTVIQSVPEDKAAWHAGVSAFATRPAVSDFSIGIEILNDGDGKDPFTDAQMESLTRLVSSLVARYRISPERIVGHRDVAIPLGRKIDPADNFDWRRLTDGIAAGVPGWHGSYTPPPRVPPPPADLQRALQDGDPQSQAEAALTAAKFRMRSLVPLLLEKVASPAAPVRQAAIYALGVLKDLAAGPDLDKALSSPEGRTRKLAMDALISLGMMGNARLRGLLADPDIQVQRGAIVVLGARADTAAIPLLRERLKQKAEPEATLLASVAALATLADTASIPDLAGLLADAGRPAAARIAAASVLGQLRASQALPALQAVAITPQEGDTLRVAAIWALPQLRSAEVRPLLAQLAHDSQPAVRDAAVPALKELTLPLEGRRSGYFRSLVVKVIAKIRALLRVSPAPDGSLLFSTRRP